MYMAVLIMVGVFLFVCSPVLAQEICDDMETDQWTFEHENPNYDGTWYAEYSTNESHSPSRSIRTSLHGGGTSGNDSDRAIATRTFSLPFGAVPDTISIWYNSMGITYNYILDAACYMIVTYPDGGEAFAAEDIVSIQWEAADSCGAEVMIELLHDDLACLVIAAVTDNDGEFTWEAVQCGEEITGYKVRVPPFISNGETLRIDTRSGEYIERA